MLVFCERPCTASAANARFLQEARKASATRLPLRRLQKQRNTCRFRLSASTFHRLTVFYPGTSYLPKNPRPAPVVIFYSGFDVVKEMLYGFIREEFVHRNISCLIMDTPCVGEPLRLRNIHSRPDYEVPTTAIIDYLETRPDVDASRIGIMGISLGGYYAPRAAAFEPRIKACVAWGRHLGLRSSVGESAGRRGR